MASTIQHFSSEALIEKITAYADKQLAGEKKQYKQTVIKFLQLYYSHSSVQELESRSVADLYGAAFSHWQLMQKRMPNELKIQIINPSYSAQGWQSTHTVIQVVTDDMPFLVDSMRMEINRLGLTIHLMIHTGGVCVARDQEGEVTDILPFQEKKEANARVEAPICMEIDRQTDSEILDKIQTHLTRVLNDVRLAVEDYEPMRQKLRDTIKDLMAISDNHEDTKESVAFLEWMLEDHFTFLGTRDYEVIGEGEEAALRLIPGSGLGLLKDTAETKMVRHFSALPELIREQELSKEHLLLLSKTNTRSTVHRHSYMDYVGVKILDKNGNYIKERRFVGLYTAGAYTGNPKMIPIVRKKVENIIKQSGLPPRSHAGKDLLHILTTLPRDDLFHGTVPELYELCMGILHLQERRKIRLFAREDAYGRFISCLVYVPRENFNADLVRQMQEILKHDLEGLEVSFSTQFSSSILVRIHYVIRIDPHKRKPYDLKQIEQKLILVAQSWQDGLITGLLEHFGEERGNALVAHYRNAFPAGYREAFLPQDALFDITQMEALTSEDMLGMSFYRPLGASKDVIRFKLYRLRHTVTLSDVLPMLENMGLRVESEQPFSILPKDREQYWINDFATTYTGEPAFEIEQVKGIFQQAFNQVWLGEAENDSFNRLVLEAQLSWREITILRGYSRYFRQTGFTFSQEYIAQTLVSNVAIAKGLMELFQYRFDPKIDGDRHEKITEIEANIHKQLENVGSLDEDRILRRYLHVINATLRTNYFQMDAQGHFKPYLSFKLDTGAIPEMPLPLPQYEIFIYSPRFEGVHLRAGKVARGGLRWSDRREDFRTEVLGLMKAQRVKNALIVPGGAKGGFFPKKLPAEGSREQILEEGIACYKEFIRGLLDVTDNLQNNEVVPPADTVCYDDADPYLVVAADKGTATFSDIANSIAIERNYWLGDAFASGGSVGYDHKKIGITARGAWVSAQRQFQELGINVDEHEITVVGIGDMSGDVFGNGLLQSPHLKLVAAFNHQHIFLDPTPDPKLSFEERQRLFNLPRSTWADYNPEIISAGGGVYSRSLKAIVLSAEVKKCLDIDKDSLPPTELIRAILKAPVDLIWNGGIGTYVKASYESHFDVRDKSNDALRVNGDQLRARVVCEGGNLGWTQLGRIEYELNGGGKINTDFIDNSGGVDCSDHEVNIKILLNQAVAAGRITQTERNALLVAMTEEVAALVLQDNYQQNRALSWLAATSKSHIGLYISHITAQEQAGKLDRALEFLPSNKELLQRKMDKLGITKPEMAILLSYSKITLKEQIIQSDLPEDPYLSICLKDLFPLPLRKDYSDIMQEHRLRREIIATQLANRLVADMGVTFIFQMQDETGASVPAIVRAYAAARAIFYMGEFYMDIESLDYKIHPDLQYEMNEEAVTLVRRAARWLLRRESKGMDIETTIKTFAEPVIYLFRRLPKYILGEDKASFESRRDRLLTASVSPAIAVRVACAELMYHGLNIIEVAKNKNRELKKVAQVYFLLLDRLRLMWFRRQINAYVGGDSYWVFLAKSSYKADLDVLQRQLTGAVLEQLDVKDPDTAAQVDAWLARREHLVERWRNILSDLRSLGVKEFAIISVAIRELAKLTQEQPGNSH